MRTPRLPLLITAVAIALGALYACLPENTSPLNESPEAWRDAILSTDPAERASACDLVAGAPGDDGVAALAELVVTDPDPRVREHAVLAITQLHGAAAVPLLRDAALGDADPDVVAASLASLERLRAEDDTPPRGFMEVDHPLHFEPGQLFTLTVRFGSVEAAPKAMLQVLLPDGFQPMGEQELRWSGPVEAGEDREITFEVRAPEHALESSMRIRLKLDYATRLDLELFHEQLRVAIADDGGRFEGQPSTRIINR